ncbi:SH3 domain-containing protein [Nereida ignava]|uniref:SH3 domain protein n=1 Tax=Nereida ignava TaxID=282199 RepID=A0A0U1NKY1_9RHOB|nr:SH3 domain-containing protein [Nereida ignava]CRK75374.1 SH3 domain protein [Nereida ignava]SFJ69582.1 SH3 domain-containing protein [Nereida ignava DSM 16309]
MWRVILLCFGFLAFAFYELSGGDEFVAESWPDGSELILIARYEPAPEPVLEDNQQAVEVAVTKAITSDAFGLAKLASPPKTNTAEASISDAVISTVALSTAVDDALKAEVILPAAPPEVIKVITGSVVNIRGGPGTVFGVVTKLNAGDEVKVIDDLGRGWVQIRTTENRIGWVADFLLGDG